jgi:hypothetical protein
MRAKNIAEFKALILKYESITLRDITDLYNTANIEDVINTLTGFGQFNTCTLCIKVHSICEECVYGMMPEGDCLEDLMEKSFYRIVGANTPRKLLYAVNERARAMRAFAKQYNIDIS